MQAIDYYKNHSTPCRAPFKECEMVPQSVFEGLPPRPALASLPPPPFLVPAILEALNASEDYKHVTKVVPGEADLYCARYTKSHGGVVLTGDSDLLVYDLGSDGVVSFFNDIEPSSHGQPGCLHTQVYQSAAIAERLGLPKSHGPLLSLAFEMFMDNHGTFPKLVSQATNLKAIKMWGSQYEDFCKEYTLGVENMDGIVPTPGTFQCVDPRISEILLQFLPLAKLAGQVPASQSPSQDTPRMFLPFLLDCPVRSSAWEISTSVRQLAYGLLNLIVPENERRFTVVEHRRQQKNASGREWQLPNLSQISDACIAVVSRLTQLEERLSRDSKADIWLAAMVCQELEWSTSLDKTPLTHIVMDQLFDLQEPLKYHNNCSWDIMHFLAQIQGSYYSFRILKQIIGVLISREDATMFPYAVGQLSSRLELLPGIYEVPDLNHVISLYQKIEKMGLLKIACEIAGIENRLPVVSVDKSVKASRTNRKRKGTAGMTGPLTRKTRSTNPFAFLEEQ